MKPRTWQTTRYDSGGSEDAALAASALANLCDADTARSLVDCVVALQRFGGEVYIGSYRRTLAPDGQIIPPEEIHDRDGTYETVGYLFFWDPVAKQTRQATEAPEEPDSDPELRAPIPLIPDSEGEESEQIEDELAATG